MQGRWVQPVDPNYPDVSSFYNTLLDDPMTHAMGAPVDELGEDFERRHRAECTHCQEFGVANIDVEYP